MSDNYTKSEQKVIETLQELTCATAEDIYSKINKEAGCKKIGLTSVYRALKKLENKYEVKPINLLNDGKIRYQLNKTENHHHHFICVNCNKAEPLDFCPYEYCKNAVKKGYIVKYHNFELYGICPACQANV